MTRSELEKLADAYQKKAEAAYRAYQETGMTRYETQWRKNEDMAEAMLMALNSKEEHDMLIHLRGDLAELASCADRIPYAPEVRREAMYKELAERVLSYAKLAGVYINMR